MTSSHTEREKRHTLSLSLEEWEVWLERRGERRGRARKIFQTLHRDFDLTLRSLHHTIADPIREEFWTPPGPESLPIHRLRSGDGTEKFLFPLREDRAVEAVWIPFSGRNTICLSTQSGCSLSCRFCSSGSIPFRGNLSAGEILYQFYSIARLQGERPGNAVFMGMGEPFLNYSASLRAGEILSHPHGSALGKRHITYSTAGILPGIRRYLEEKRGFPLALSLHSPFPEERARWMDVERIHPLEEILELLEKNRSGMKRRAITLEYTIFRGLNDSPEHARKLVAIALRVDGRINLIPYHGESGEFHTPTREEMDRFWKLCHDEGVMPTTRSSRGSDIQGACGMLACREDLNPPHSSRIG